MSEEDDDEPFGASAVLGLAAALLRRDAPALAGLAVLLLVVPGVALQCRWLAALPAKIGERIGPRAAMARSRALSRDASGTIFGLLCCYAVSERIATWIATVPGQGTGEAGRWVVLALGLLVSVLFATLSSVGSAAVYLDLRRRAGGAPPAEVVEAFA